VTLRVKLVLKVTHFTIHPTRKAQLTVIKKVKAKVKRSRYRAGVAQRVGRGIALLFHDLGTRRG